MLKKFHDGAANEAYIFAAISRPLLKSDDIEVLKWYRMEKVLQKILSFVMLCTLTGLDEFAAQTKYIYFTAEDIFADRNNHALHQKSKFKLKVVEY